jgi:hypothetical protein
VGQPDLDEAELCIERIRREILSYVARFPRASDTLPGIARWWVGAPAPLDRVQAALDRLVGEGHLIAVLGPDKALHYSAPPSRQP